MHNLQDKDNLDPNYKFILDNLDILKTEVDLWNLTTKYPERKSVSIIQNQNLINLKRQIIRDVSENSHNLIYFNAYQWETIQDTVNAI